MAEPNSSAAAYQQGISPYGGNYSPPAMGLNQQGGGLSTGSALGPPGGEGAAQSGAIAGMPYGGPITAGNPAAGGYGYNPPGNYGPFGNMSQSTAAMSGYGGGAGMGRGS